MYSTQMLGSHDDSTVVVLFTLAYLFLSWCFVAPPTEFVSAGITVQNLCSCLLGSEPLDFIRYHQRRTTLTLLLHSCIPLGYYLGLVALGVDPGSLGGADLRTVAALFVWLSLFAVSTVSILAIYWHSKGCERHPISQQLARLASGSDTWQTVAASVNVEFRRIDKFVSGTPSQLVVVTDSWIIKTSTYYVYIAHQAGIHLTLSKAEEHVLSYQNHTSVQYLNILVGRPESMEKQFELRLNSLELSDLKEKLHAPIRNARNIVIHQSLSDRFLMTFRECVEENPVYVASHNLEVEQCIGCMHKMADVKLQKHCQDNTSQGAQENCAQCFCRPMWCMECLGKWFASRQDQQRPETWLSSKSPCPTCRARFCMLDVCKLQIS